MLGARPRHRTASPSSMLTSSPPTSVADHFHWSDTERGHGIAGTEIGTETERSSTRTSMSAWSDDKTEVPPATPLEYDDGGDDDGHFHRLVGMGTEYGVEAKEGRLIDLDDDDDEGGVQPNTISSPAAMGATSNPTQKLRELLREMEKQAKEAVPTPTPAPAPASSTYQTSSTWDRRRSFGLPSSAEMHEMQSGSGSESDAGPSVPTASRMSPRRIVDEEGDEDGEAEDEDEQEQESPPTPPPRIGNPYVGRRVSGERRGSPSFAQPGRMPSRAAVLLQSTSRSPPPDPPTSPPAVQTPLQAFIASHPSDPSSSRLSRSLNDSHSSSGSSRKGKGRASPSYNASPSVPAPVPTAETSASRRNRFRQQHQQYHQSRQYAEAQEESLVPAPSHVPGYRVRSQSPDLPTIQRNGRPPPTPRRSSVDVAPDDSASFIRGLDRDDGVPVEMELDLDEGLSAVVGWDDTSASAASVVESERETSRQFQTAHSHEYPDVDRTAGRTPFKRSISPRFSQKESLKESGSFVLRQRSREETSLRADHPNAKSRSYTTSRNSPSQSQIYHSARNASRDQEQSPPLPALPEPDFSGTDESEHDAYASRRAALFRSTSKSASQSTSTVVGHTTSTSRGLSATPSFRTSKEGSSSPSTSNLLPKRFTSSSPSPIKYQTTPAQRPADEDRSASRSASNVLPPRHVSEIPIPPQLPIQVGFASISTPQKNLDPNMSTAGAPTPRPPGAWGTPVHMQKNRVRFSPLRREVPVGATNLGQGGNVLDKSSEIGWEEGPSIHRLRVSPRKSPKKQAELSGIGLTPDLRAEGKDVDSNEPVDADTSWTARLSRSFTKASIPIPKPSTTMKEAQTALDTAASTSRLAHEKVEATQRQWLDALASIREHASEGVGAGMESVGRGLRRGWKWSSLGWWVLMEVILLWGVFRANSWSRVTLDYATSTAYITSFDPFHPLSRPSASFSLRSGSGSSSSMRTTDPFLALGLPVPAGISTFVDRSGTGSGNFFDILEAWGVWTLGVSAGAGAGAGAADSAVSGGAGGADKGMRMLGGVPT